MKQAKNQKKDSAEEITVALAEGKEGGLYGKARLTDGYLTVSVYASKGDGENKNGDPITHFMKIRHYKTTGQYQKSYSKPYKKY